MLKHRLQKISCKLRNAAVSFSILFLIACDRKPLAGELYGTYIAKQGFAVDRLEIAANGTFTQEVVFTATGKRFTTNGTWQLDIQKSQVIFSGFLAVRDKFGRPQNTVGHLNGLVIMPFIKHNGTLQIGDRPADYWADVYHKTNSNSSKLKTGSPIRADLNRPQWASL